MTKAGAKISLLYGSHILYGQITCAHRLVNDGSVALFFHGNGNTDRFLKKMKAIAPQMEQWLHTNTHICDRTAVSGKSPG